MDIYSLVPFSELLLINQIIPQLDIFSYPFNYILGTSYNYRPAIKLSHRFLSLSLHQKSGSLRIRFLGALGYLTNLITQGEVEFHQEYHLVFLLSSGRDAPILSPYPLFHEDLP